MVSGSCLCGGVRFEIDGTLTPIQHCHARRCRKASGSAFAAEAAAERTALRWTQGEDLITTWEAPLLHDPPPYRRAFCRVCGSPLPAPLEGTDFVVLQAGVLDEPFPARLFRHVFVAQHAPWYAIEDDLPRFDERPPPEARLPERRG